MNSRPLSSHVLAMSPQVMDTPCRKSPQTEHWHSSSVPFSSSSVAEQPQMISEKSKSRALFLTNSSSSDPSNSNSSECASPPKEGRQRSTSIQRVLPVMSVESPEGEFPYSTQVSRSRELFMKSSVSKLISHAILPLEHSSTPTAVSHRSGIRQPKLVLAPFSRMKEKSMIMSNMPLYSLSSPSEEVEVIVHQQLPPSPKAMKSPPAHMSKSKSPRLRSPRLKSPRSKSKSPRSKSKSPRSSPASCNFRFRAPSRMDLRRYDSL